MNWLRKIFGYKYKIMYMKTDFRASEFQKTVLVKLPIDVEISPQYIDHGMNPTWMWAWDYSSAKTIYTKSGNNVNMRIVLDGTNDFYNSKAIKNHFNN